MMFRIRQSRIVISRGNNQANSAHGKPTEAMAVCDGSGNADFFAADSFKVTSSRTHVTVLLLKRPNGQESE